MKTRPMVWLIGGLALSGIIYLGWSLVNQTSDTATKTFIDVQIEPQQLFVPPGETITFHVTAVAVRDFPDAAIHIKLGSGLIFATIPPTQHLDLLAQQPQTFTFAVQNIAPGEDQLMVSVGQNYPLGGIQFIWLYSDAAGTEVRLDRRPRPAATRDTRLIPLDQMPTSKPTATP
ncbi:MAG: hypothetical protein H0T53_00175 [Herpetosiphonaceae bacterium]|nr:hypothetical protein [Herpetosiphonaceae bacterium]